MSATSTTVLTELRRLCDAAGELTPQAVVDDARPEDAPLHAHFEWDDSIAGEQYRLVQASEMIRKAQITVETTTPRAAVRVRAFLSVPSADADGRTGVYRPIEVLARDTRVREELLDQMRRDIAQLRRKYRDHEAAFNEILLGAVSEISAEEPAS